MDEQQLAQLVQRVEHAFPGDPVAQRQAWEFIESVFAAWDEVTLPELGIVASAAGDAANDTGRRFLEAFQSLLRDSGGRLASAVQVLLPPAPGLATLSRAEAAQTVDVAPDVAAVTGLEGSISVEHGTDYLTLVVRVAEESQPSRLAGIVYLPDETIVVRRFERVEPTVAAAHFDLPASDGPIGIVVAILDDEE
jgi:hypothetical protein